MQNRPSRCLSPSRAPQVLHWATIGGDRTLVSREIQEVVDALDEPLRIDAAASLIALFGRIEQCLAVDPDDVVPVARYSYMWEFRINDHASGIRLRLYCAELDEYPNTVIVLHAHAKLVEGSPAEIKQWQDEAISQAAIRFEAGRREAWGL